MNKIATAEQLQAELRDILAMTEEPGPSREKLAAALESLADRVAIETPGSTLAKRARAMKKDIDTYDDQVSTMYNDLEKFEKLAKYIRNARPDDNTCQQLNSDTKLLSKEVNAVWLRLSGISTLLARIIRN